MDNSANGGNGGDFAGMTQDFGALENFAKATEADSKASNETKKAMGQAAATGYAVDLTGEEISQEDFKEIKNKIGSGFKMKGANGEDDVDLHAMADWEGEMMAKSLKGSFQRDFGGKAVEAAKMAANVMDFADFAKGDNSGDAKNDNGGDGAAETGVSAEQELLGVISDNQGGSEAA